MARWKIAVIVIASLLVLVILTIGILTVIVRTKPTEAPDRVSTGIHPTEEQVAAAVKYSRVLIIGVDGAGGYFGEMDTPNFDRVFENGSITYTGLSQKPTVSAENWTSMLHGVSYQTHCINNTVAATVPWMRSKYPSVFKAYSKLHKEAKFLSSTTWSPINYGIIENMSSMKKIYPKNSFPNDPTEQKLDAYNVDKTIEALGTMDPVITFVHLDSVDHAGHGSGYGSSEYVECMEKIDLLIGRLYDTYVEKGWADDTLFVLVSDHGHTLKGGHGGEEETEKNVTFAVAGAKGNIIKGTMGRFVTHDLASVVMYGLGEKQPDVWEGGVPENIFTTLQ